MKSLVAELMRRNPLEDPFVHETALVQSAGMAQWLQIQLAEDFGITANIDCSLPAAFVWRLFTQILPNVPVKSAFGKTAMSWKLMVLLRRYQEDDRFRSLRHYLSDDGQQRKLCQLAQQIADLFDHYLVYRPEWIAAWQQGQQLPQLGADQPWQALLWQALTQYSAELSQSHYHRADLYHALITALKQTPRSQLLTLPKRLFIFAISSSPPIFWQLVQALAQHIDIHMMLIDPCRHCWWEPLTSPVESHPLLASWGQQGREQHGLLAQIDAIEIDAMADIAGDTLLHALQHDLLEEAAEANRGSEAYQRLLDPHDISLTLHACYSPLREVEVLHDNLLAFMEADPTLITRDIVVMVADLPHYAPYIQAIFGQAPADRHLPFTLADDRNSVMQPILRAFLTLLSLPNSRFQAEEILALLEVPAVAARFSINEDALRRLRLWIGDTGIRWGLDNHHAADLQLPTDGRHTWHFGLTRMLLGYAMSEGSGPFRGVLPYVTAGGATAELIGHLANFLAQLDEWRQRLRQPQPLSAWLPYGQQLLSAFFVREASSEAALALLEQQWQQWISEGIESCYEIPVSHTLIRDALTTCLEQPAHNEQFLTGAVIFCSLMPLRTIPFKVICLLGMNDGCYPRIVTRLSFDLMSSFPRLGDRSHSNEDRYLFLEALLSAQSILYLSYVGRSAQDNRQQHPSVLISELLDYCCQHYRLVSDQHSPPTVAAEHLRQHLQHEHPLMPFDFRCFQPKNRWQSYAAEWLSMADTQPIDTQPFGLQPLVQFSAPTTITLSDLQYFYRHPTRYFFQQRLQVKFKQNSQMLPPEEPFILDPLARYQLNQSLLNALINQEDASQLYLHTTAAGALPQGVFGQLLWQQQCQALQPLVSRIHDRRLPTQTQLIDLTVNEIQLIGLLPHVQVDGLLRWRPVVLNITHGFELWLEHLLYCAMGYTGSSHLYGIRDSSWHFRAMAPDSARTLLAELLDGWQQGQLQPLLLAPKCGWSWVQTLYQAPEGKLLRSPSQRQKAEQTLRQIWQGNHHRPGEGCDLYYQRLVGKLSSTHITAISRNAERFLLPLAHYSYAE